MPRTMAVWITVEPPNKGHFGSRTFVLFSEVVLWWEVRADMQFIAPSRSNIPRQHILKLKIHFYTDVLLKLKHPEAKSVDLSTIVSSDSLPCDPHPVIYEQITGPLVRSVALKTERAAGPSGIDAQGWRWRRLCSSALQY